MADYPAKNTYRSNLRILKHPPPPRSKSYSDSSGGEKNRLCLKFQVSCCPSIKSSLHACATQRWPQNSAMLQKHGWYTYLRDSQFQKNRFPNLTSLSPELAVLAICRKKNCLRKIPDLSRTPNSKVFEKLHSVSVGVKIPEKCIPIGEIEPDVSKISVNKSKLSRIAIRLKPQSLPQIQCRLSEVIK